ncbi:MAG: S8 family serine peptidase [Schleiferiaceae bacterium]|nr:S8 family serine peptidase [Schleiferiaceae bacterium]
MKTAIATLILTLSSLLSAQNQQMWVFIQEDQTHLGTPALSDAAMQRRVNQGIALSATDYPLNPMDVKRIASTGVKIRSSSRWLRAVSVIGTEEQMQRIAAMDRVIDMKPVADLQLMDGTMSYNYGLATTQTQQIDMQYMHNAGYEGQGIHIAVLDAGFTGVELHAAFASMWSQSRLLHVHDFVDGDSNVFHGSGHGTAVLSTMCADLDATMVGTAPKASYSLFRTEDVASETLAEEDNWIRAAEWADSLGADLINTSLGYSTFDDSVDNHSYTDMDGRTTPISIAANMAARKGIIVVVAAGNEGGGAWRHITAPADADSILTAGAVDGNGLRAGFSGQGPTSDGRIKPDLATMGAGPAVINSAGQVTTSNGTSFSSPILCGAMATVLQAVIANQSSYDIQSVMQSVKNVSSHASQPDTLMGWGIPNFHLVLLNILGLDESTSLPSWWFSEEVDGLWLQRAQVDVDIVVERLSIDGRNLARYHLPQGQARLLLGNMPAQSVLRLSNAITGQVDMLPLPANPFY